MHNVSAVWASEKQILIDLEDLLNSGAMALLKNIIVCHTMYDTPAKGLNIHTVWFSDVENSRSVSDNAHIILSLMALKCDYWLWVAHRGSSHTAVLWGRGLICCISSFAAWIAWIWYTMFTIIAPHSEISWKKIWRLNQLCYYVSFSK